jgi:hypothetical protein
MRGIRETSFISSATNSESREYKLILRLTPELKTAIQDDLEDISNHLLSCGMITQDNHEDFTNCYKPTHTRAASLIRAVQNKIRIDCRYFSKFVKILEKNKQYYSSILQRLYSHDMDSPPMYSQQHICEDDLSMSESDETAALLHVHVPYVQYEDDSQCREPERWYSLSSAVYIFCSSCMKVAAKRPLPCITSLVLIVIGFSLIMIGQVNANYTSVCDYFLMIALCTVSFCICFLIGYCCAAATSN